MDKKLVQEEFLNSVKDHYIEVVKDDRLFRHIVMSQGSTHMRYEITTWPGYLCISGDMGCYVFRRIDDMFQFFRSDSKELKINKVYWHGKLEGVDRQNGSTEYSSDLFDSAVKNWFDMYTEDDEDKSNKQRIWEEIKRDVLYHNDNEQDAFRAANDFEYEGFNFCDFWEVNLKDFTYHYVWCLYAIVYAIQKYDSIKDKDKVGGKDDVLVHI